MMKNFRIPNVNVIPLHFMFVCNCIVMINFFRESRKFIALDNFEDICFDRKWFLLIE